MTEPEVKKQEAEKQPEPGASATPAETEVTPKSTEAVSPEESTQDPSRYQARINQITAARRSAEERARLAEDRLAMMQQQNSTEVTTGRPDQQVEKIGQMTKDEWLNWHEEDPLAATEYVSDIKANQKAQQIMTQMQTAGAYSDTVAQVYKAHPELKEVMEGRKTPEEAPFWQVFDQVAKEMPETQQLAKGPYIVMREAERRIKEQELSDKEKSIANNAATQEQDRQQRVGASYTTGSVPRPPSTPSAKLSPEEERIARKMGMTPEEYSKNKKVK